jgi:hypothetical protein
MNVRFITSALNERPSFCSDESCAVMCITIVLLWFTTSWHLVALVLCQFFIALLSFPSCAAYKWVILSLVIVPALASFSVIFYRLDTTIYVYPHCLFLGRHLLFMFFFCIMGKLWSGIFFHNQCLFPSKHCYFLPLIVKTFMIVLPLMAKWLLVSLNHQRELIVILSLTKILPLVTLPHRKWHVGESSNIIIFPHLCQPCLKNQPMLILLLNLFC